MAQGYSNRTDLTANLPVTTAKSKTYGDATASRQAQQIVPMGNPTPPRPPVVSLGAPSERPNEPITAGADFGLGPNATQAGLPPVPKVGNVRELLIFLNSQHPNSDIENLLSTLMDD